MELISCITLPYSVIRVVLDLSWAEITGILWRPTQWGYRRNLAYTFLRSMVHHEVFDLVRAKKNNTILVYQTYMGKHGHKPETINLDHGATGGWIGSPKAKQVLLFLHGGAYRSVANPTHLEVLIDLISAANRKGKELGIFVVDYEGLTPNMRYPHQLIRAAVALNYLMDILKHKPSNIFIFGDSAGANLAIGLLSTVIHRHPEVPSVDFRGEDLAGVFLLSPWVTFDDTSKSMKENEQKDWLSQKSLRLASQEFLGGEMEDYYNTPLLAPVSWWEDLPVKEICTVVGGYEIFRDDVIAWVDMVNIHNPRFEISVAPAEIHCQPMTDRGLGLGISGSEEYLRAWILENIS